MTTSGQRPVDLSEGLQGDLDVLFGMSRHERGPDPAHPFRDRWRPDGGRIDAVLPERRRELERGPSPARENRHDRRVGGKDGEADVRETALEHPYQAPEVFPPRGLALDYVYRGERCGERRGRKRGVKNIAPDAVPDEIDQLSAPGNVTAERAYRL